MPPRSTRSSRGRSSRSSRRPRSPAYALIHVGTRILGWLSALAAVLLLSYVGVQYPSKGQVVVAGIMGAIIALFNDSWDVAALMDNSRTLPRFAAARRVLHDLCSIALCVGGTIMLWISNIQLNGTGNDDDDSTGQTYLISALWVSFAVVVVRLCFIIWGCVDCSRDQRERERRRRRRRRRRQGQSREPWDLWDNDWLINEIRRAHPENANSRSHGTRSMV